MTAPPVIPRPQSIRSLGGFLTLGRDAGVRGPASVCELARELLGLTGSGGADLDLRLEAGASLAPEAYRLVVGPDGIVATAADAAGLRWAVQTLRQLEQDHRLPCVEIEDRPRFGWRGALLDVARWCHPLAFLHRFVDLLALHKLNTLHLHLTDDQGWRFEVKRYPRLTAVGGTRAASVSPSSPPGELDGVPHSGHYTQRELRDLVAYAAARGIRIMPEIDLPGHSQAAIAAYPWLGNRPDVQLPVRSEWGISSHVLGVADRAVAAMCDVLDELTDVFPFGCVHIGGDETPSAEWEASEAARRRVAAAGLGGAEQLVGWWSRKLAEHLAGLGRRSAVWDELLEHGPPADATVFAWRGVQHVDLALRAGHDTVAAPYEHTYLDWAEGEGPDEPPAIAGTLPLETVYEYEPPDEVLGVQGQLWSEYLPTVDLVEWRAFPRLTALAEVGWSDAPRDHGDFRRRLGPHLDRLAALGVRYRPLDEQPTAAERVR